MTATIPCVKDDRGYLHAPFEERTTHAVCGIEGVYVDFPATYTGRWCTTCIEDCRSSGGERLWPIVEEPA